MSDFGGIWDSIVSLGDDLGITSKGLSSALISASKTYSAGSGSSGAGYNAIGEASRLSTGSREVPIRQDYQATPGRAVEGVNADAIEQRWLQRLNKFAQIQAETGVKGAK